MLVGRSYNNRIDFSLQEQRGNLFQRPVERMLDLVPRYAASVRQVAANVDGARATAAELTRQIDSALGELSVNYQSPLGRALKFSDAELAARGRRRPGSPSLRTNGSGSGRCRKARRRTRPQTSC